MKRETVKTNIFIVLGIIGFALIYKAITKKSTKDKEIQSITTLVDNDTIILNTIFLDSLINDSTYIDTMGWDTLIFDSI